MSRSTARPTAMPQALPNPCAARPTCTAPMLCARSAIDRAQPDRAPSPPTITGLRPNRSDTGPNAICPIACAIRKIGTTACTSSMEVPSSRCIEKNAGSVMSQENALTDSSSPQKAMRVAAVHLEGAAQVPSPHPSVGRGLG